jgi:hypothetical protein
MNAKTSLTLALLTGLACSALGTAALAKLPAPVLSPEAKLKAAEAAAKTAHGNKVADFQLCKSMDRAASNFQAVAKQRGDNATPDASAPACTDPGPFVFTPPPAAPAAAAPAAPAPAAAAPAAVAPAAAAPK